MLAALTTPLQIGSITLPHRLIQGPLAGFSCAPFRKTFNQFSPPAFCVSEMMSANDVLYKHANQSRYIYRAPEEHILCYQIAGSDPAVMAKAASRLASLGASMIDINCGCPKPKIRKKGAGSALLENEERLYEIVAHVRAAISIPLTVKLRILGDERDIELATKIEAQGADALIVHGRRFIDDYDMPCDYLKIQQIKAALKIPVIANGDISDKASLEKAVLKSQSDAYMISRAGTGKPWLYQALLNLNSDDPSMSYQDLLDCFLMHLEGLKSLESEYQAVLQSRQLVRYYFGRWLNFDVLQGYYQLTELRQIRGFLRSTALTLFRQDDMLTNF